MGVSHIWRNGGATDSDADVPDEQAVGCQTDTTLPNTADVGIQTERMTRPDVFRLPPLLSLNICIQATRDPGGDPNYLLARIAAAYRTNLDRPLPFWRGETCGQYYLSWLECAERTHKKF